VPSEPRHAVVTGSSSGIGRAVAERLLQGGWQVTGLDLAPAVIAHSHFQHRAVDLSQALAAGDMARGLGPVQALVHAAGVLRVGRLGQAGVDHAADAQMMWHLHVAAASALAGVLVPAMVQERHGRVVLIGSRVAQGKAGRGQYAASKAALVALARSWAAEVVSQGVTVNVVSPAATDTAMLTDPARAGTTPVLPPLGRLIGPGEVASLVAYLLSADAAAVTGQDIAICGGASLPA
jgi:3-oxoacyl-[acyl-carrier protein] reductase